MRNLVKTEERQKKVRVTMKVARLNVLNAMEQIVELSSGSDLSKDFSLRRNDISIFVP